MFLRIIFVNKYCTCLLHAWFCMVFCVWFFRFHNSNKKNLIKAFLNPLFLLILKESALSNDSKVQFLQVLASVKTPRSNVSHYFLTNQYKVFTAKFNQSLKSARSNLPAAVISSISSLKWTFWHEPLKFLLCKRQTNEPFLFYNFNISCCSSLSFWAAEMMNNLFVIYFRLFLSFQRNVLVF